MDDVDPRNTRLDEERTEALGRLRSLTAEFDDVVAASRDTNADDEHDPEGATIAFERSQVGALVRQVQEHLSEIDAAERRLADGTYGTCERCGEPIGDDRLEARPVARTCIRCATRTEGHGRRVGNR
ncbi:MAG TPA: TraR/DksA C4-type zinc finger protein [Nocardioides sp.]|nr:TraR/DksA C4-type zinc finger protein [Nocardioides sp.]